MRRVLRATFGAALVTSALAACTEAPGGDTAWLEQPDLVLTQADLPEELAGETLFRVRGLAALELEEGNPVVAIADAGNDRLLFWWPEEGRTESFGRPGAGPGEFGSIYALWPTGGGFMVSDLRLRRLMFVDVERGQTGTAPRDLGNLGGGGAFLPDGLFVVPTDHSSDDPFEFRRLTVDGDRIGLEQEQRPTWFPEVASLERPVHPVYDEAGLLFPPLAPISTDVVIPLGEELVWVEQRTGQVVVMPLEGSDPASLDGITVAPIPDRAIEDHVRSWVDTRGEAGMREQHFQAFWTANPDAEGRRVLLPIVLSTGDPLGWLLEARPGGGLEARTVRLPEGEELPYRVAAALPLAQDRYLVGHEGGLTLLVPAAERDRDE